MTFNFSKDKIVYNKLQDFLFHKSKIIDNDYLKRLQRDINTDDTDTEVISDPKTILKYLKEYYETNNLTKDVVDVKNLSNTFRADPILLSMEIKYNLNETLDVKKMISDLNKNLSEDNVIIESEFVKFLQIQIYNNPEIKTFLYSNFSKYISENVMNNN